MKKYIIYFLMIVCVSFVACDNRENREYDEHGEIVINGSVSFAKINFDLQVLFNGAKSGEVVNVLKENFIVKIVNKSKGEIIHKWKQSEIPEKILLKIGKYTIEAIYPEVVINGAWEQPAYFGSTDFEVKEGKTTTIETITCRPSNMKVSIVYTSEALSQIASCVATVKVGVDGTQIFKFNETRSAYFNPAPLTVYIVGKTKDGQSFDKNISIKNCVAGDNHVIEIKEVISSGDGKLSINIDVTTNDKEIDFVVSDDDVALEPEPDPDPDPENPDPNPDVNLPSVAGIGFDITKVINHKSEEAKNVDVMIIAKDGGIQMLKVVINSPELESILTGLGLSPTFDLANLSPKERDAFTQLDIIKEGEEIKGKTEFKFSIGPFMTILPIGTHKFNVEVKDAKNNSAKSTLTISVS